FGLVDDLLDDRPERATRTAPGRPQIHDDRDLVGPLHDLGLEGLIGDVNGAHEQPGYRRDGPVPRWRGAAAAPLHRPTPESVPFARWTPRSPCPTPTHPPSTSPT